MTTSVISPNKTSQPTEQGAFLLPWIHLKLECLWLLSVFLIPLAFLGQNYSISEALIANVEVPKVALLRLLAATIAVLWLTEWAITSRAFENQSRNLSIGVISNKLNPIKTVPALLVWLSVHPTRWFVAATGLFFGSTFLCTGLSGSFTNSMWGEIPGQDGYSAYTIASYCMLFSVIATHLKSPAQLRRLLSAVILMGSLVGLYSVLQHYDHDIFNLSESTGGAKDRGSVFMGNPIFAAAVLSMTVPITLIAGAINLRNETLGSWGPLTKLGQLGRDTLFTFLWSLVLSSQILGLIFTYSRGPWLGTALAVTVFLTTLVVSSGSRIMIRTLLVLVLSGVLVAALLQWQGSLSVFNYGRWLGFVITSVGLIGTFSILYVIKKFSRNIIFIAAAGAIITIAATSAMAPSTLSRLGSAAPTVSSASTSSATSQIGGRISSIKSDVLSGYFGGRDEHWAVSWTIIKDRPWFEFDDLSFQWLRHLVGYGPDLFRYTYLLESPPGSFNFYPSEPDHAHNYFIHQIVEQGILGGVACLSLFVAAFWIAIHHLLFRKRNSDSMYRILLFGLIAVFLGRFVEMSVGVARISDLTVLWVLFGLFAALMKFDHNLQEHAKATEVLSEESTPFRDKRNAHRAKSAQSLSTSLIIRLGIAAMLVGGLGIVTWDKSINSVRASVAEAKGINHFQNNDLKTAEKYLDKAIHLAPGVPTYYNNLAQIYLSYFIRPESITEPDCAGQSDMEYRVCLGLKSLNLNLTSIDQQPFNFYARAAAANSAYNLRLDSTVDLYRAVVTMVPYSYIARNELADTLMSLNLYNDALVELNRSLEFTGESQDSSEALYLKGKSLKEMNRYEEAIEALTLSLSLYPDPDNLSINLIDEIYTLQGLSDDIEYFNKQVMKNSDNAVAFYFRGLAHFRIGDETKGHFDIETASRLGLNPRDISTKTRQALITQTIANARLAIANSLQAKPSDHNYSSALMTIGNAYLDLHQWKAAVESFTELILLSPANANNYKKRGDALISLKRYEEALEDYKRAASLDSINSIHLVGLGDIYTKLGDFEVARRHFDKSIELNPNSSDAYASRGLLSNETGNYTAAISDVSRAIDISPVNDDAHFKKAQIHIAHKQLPQAITKLDKAISLSPINSDYFYTRGLLKTRIEDYNGAITDFTIAIELNDHYSFVDPQHVKPFEGRSVAFANGGILPVMPVSSLRHALLDANTALELLEQRFNTPEWDYYQPEIKMRLSDIHTLLGDVYSELDQPVEAENEYKRSSEYR